VASLAEGVFLSTWSITQLDHLLEIEEGGGKLWLGDDLNQA
jgi:hypothetical protein